jgi:hypothetical protein
MTGPVVYCYIHLQKNAGNTVRAWMEETFQGGFWETMSHGRMTEGRAKTWGDEPDALDEVRRFVGDREHAAVAANLPFGLHEHLDRDVQYFTFLREPVARARSFWQHAFRLRAHGAAWTVIEDAGRDPARAAGQGLLQLANDQTRMLTGSTDTTIGREHLECAKRLIKEGRVWVWSMEDIEVGLGKVASRAGVLPAAVEVVNKGEATPDDIFPDDVDERFAELNAVDIELFDWLRSR